MQPLPKKLTPKMRLVAWQVQPIVMIDDGKNLTPLPIDAVQIPASQWNAFKQGDDEIALNNLRSQIEGHGEAATDQ
jgi:hypothetical protein